MTDHRKRFKDQGFGLGATADFLNLFTAHQKHVATVLHYLAAYKLASMEEQEAFRNHLRDPILITLIDDIVRLVCIAGPQLGNIEHGKLSAKSYVYKYTCKKPSSDADTLSIRRPDQLAAAYQRSIYTKDFQTFVISHISQETSALRYQRLISSRKWDPFEQVHLSSDGASVRLRRQPHQESSAEEVISRQIYYRAGLLSHHEGLFQYLQSEPCQYSRMDAEGQKVYIKELMDKFRPFREACSGCGRKNTDVLDHLHTLVALDAIGGEGLLNLRLNHILLHFEYRTHRESFTWQKLEDSKDILRVGGCKVESILRGKLGRAQDRVTKTKKTRIRSTLSARNQVPGKRNQGSGPS